jgi:hypothetical protein
MFVVTDAVPRRHRHAQAREWARTVAGWKPLPLRPLKRLPKPPRLRRVR